jgi:hypothetical protein
MLVGPSITLEKLEEHMKDRLYGIKMELPKLRKEFTQLADDFKRIPRLVIEKRNDGTEVEVANPDFVKIPDDMKAIEAKIKDLQDQQELMETKLDELDTIEERSQMRGNRKIDKSTEKITLTLNDCVALGIELDEAPQE